MKKTAFLFPGQGSQSVGMGEDLYQEYGHVREIFDMAEEISKIHISKLCFNGPMEDLTMTVNLQPAVTAVNLGVLAVLQKAGVSFDYTAGHSLGEYSALCASNVISSEDTVRLVYKRGELMNREALKHKGIMYAVIGLPIDAVTELVLRVKETGGLKQNETVSVANHNTEQQIVITGSPEPVQKVSELAAEKGAKAVLLKVSGAWHSELMKDAQAEFMALLGQTPFNDPEKPIVLNVTADISSNSNEIKDIMGKQLCSPVKWYDAMKKLLDENVEIFAEIGPGKVLTGLLKKIAPKDKEIAVYNLNSLKSIEAFYNNIS